MVRELGIATRGQISSIPAYSIPLMRRGEHAALVFVYTVSLLRDRDDEVQKVLMSTPVDLEHVYDPSLAVGHVEGPIEVSYNTRDLLVYAVGIGCSTRRNKSDHAYNDELRFLYERHPAFTAFPTYSLVLPLKGISSDVVDFPGEIDTEVFTGGHFHDRLVCKIGLRWNYERRPRHQTDTALRSLFIRCSSSIQGLLTRTKYQDSINNFSYSFHDAIGDNQHSSLSVLCPAPSCAAPEEGVVPPSPTTTLPGLAAADGYDIFSFDGSTQASTKRKKTQLQP